MQESDYAIEKALIERTTRLVMAETHRLAQRRHWDEIIVGIGLIAFGVGISQMFV